MTKNYLIALIWLASYTCTICSSEENDSSQCLAIIFFSKLNFYTFNLVIFANVVSGYKSSHVQVGLNRGDEEFLLSTFWDLIGLITFSSISINYKLAYLNILSFWPLRAGIYWYVVPF